MRSLLRALVAALTVVGWCFGRCAVPLDWVVAPEAPDDGLPLTPDEAAAWDQLVQALR